MKIVASSKGLGGIAGLLDSNSKSPSGVKSVFLGVILVAVLLSSSYYRIVTRLSARTTAESQILSSRDGLFSVTRCPEQLKTCETRLHSCGEQALGCEELLDQCRRIALTCRKAMETTKFHDLPEGWVTHLTEEWDVRFKGHGLGQKPKNPFGDCGKHGYMGGDGKCRCAIMYAGADCQHGFTLKWMLSTHYDKAYNHKPEMRTFNGEYWGSIALSQQSTVGGSVPGRHNWMGQDMIMTRFYRDMKTGKNKKDMRNLGRADGNLFEYLPELDDVGKKVYDQCAVVGSSGVLLNFKQGKEIDRHDMVMRFNAAPVTGFERHVGSKTTFRLVTTPFLPFNEGGEKVLHAPESSKTVEAWRRRAENRALQKSAPIYLLDPAFTTWQQGVVMEWKPTIAWTGIMLAMQICRRVDLYGVLVGETQGTPHHYFDTCSSPASVREKDEAEMREWTLLRSFKEMGMLHFMEPCVIECRASEELCLACRRRAPGYSETISPELHELRTSRKHPNKRYCKRADLHHAVADLSEKEEVPAEEYTAQVEDWEKVAEKGKPGKVKGGKGKGTAGSSQHFQPQLG